MLFVFEPEPVPFPRWMGPFSPSRGNRSGFRFRSGELGTWVTHQLDQEFWACDQTVGVRLLQLVVLKSWRGGRVLFLPNGFVVKPLQDDDVGQRELIGRFKGPLVLKKPSGERFSMADPPGTSPGSDWQGPDTTGLACYLEASTGSLSCTWYHPTGYGRQQESHVIRGPDPKLAAGFRRCRPHADGGRVRVTANGHVLTKRQSGATSPSSGQGFGPRRVSFTRDLLSSNSWVTLYVGRVDPASFGDWSHWATHRSPWRP